MTKFPPAGPPRRRDRITTVSLVVATLWCVGLIVAAATVPSYRSTSVSASVSARASATAGSDNAPPPPAPPVIRSTSATLLQENGSRVLLPLAIPFLAVAGVASALRRRRALGRPGAGAVAWVVTSTVIALSVLGMMTIGLFVLPVAVILAVACGRAPTRAS